MGTVTLPYTITNGSTTDAVKVMADLNAIVTEVNGNLESVNIKDLAVITEKLAALAVTAAKIATDAVETLKIKDLNVTAAKLATDAVETLKIKDANVTAIKLATDSVETLKIKDLNVTTGKLAADAVTNPKIADDAVQAENVLGLTGSGTVSLANIPGTLDNVPNGATRGSVTIISMLAQAPAGTYNGIGDSKVRVKEDITYVPTSGVLEIDGDAYEYTSVSVVDKEFTLSGTLSQTYAEDDYVYIQSSCGRLAIFGGLWLGGNSLILGNLEVDGAALLEADAVKDQGGIATNGLKCKICEIGDWNMDATVTKNVAHGLTLSKIRSLGGIIRNDDDTCYYQMPTSSTSDPDLYMYADSTNVNISRTPSGTFDNVSFNSTSYNRGWLMIWYEG